LLYLSIKKAKIFPYGIQQKYFDTAKIEKTATENASAGSFGNPLFWSGICCRGLFQNEEAAFFLL
jgi:hypothetical protein